MATDYRSRLVRWINRRADEPVRNMKLFTSGGLIFVAGMMGLVMAERFLAAGSLNQEIVAALSLLVAGGGALRALYGYLAMGLFKLLQYFFTD